MQRLCVYCGSKPGHREIFMNAARSLALSMADRDLDLVYGGASVGLMGQVANTMLSKQRAVYGVIPKSIAELEVAHPGLSQLDVVEDMHQRKARMMSLSDGFIALPGGLGTLEEIFEALTWLQLGFHQKPCGLLNIDGYYDHLLSFLRGCEQQGFVLQSHLDNLLVASDPNDLLNLMQNHIVSKTAKL